MHKYIKIWITFFLLLLTMSVIAQDEKKGGHITMQMSENDTMHVITATVTDSISGQPLKNVELTFYIKRMFGSVNVGKATTDTMGIASTEFPKDFRSDATGKIIFMTKVEDNDIINDVSIQMTLKPDLNYIKNKPFQRAMIGRYAPWWLVATFVLTVGTVCLLFIYVLYLVYLIKKASIIKLFPDN